MLCSLIFLGARQAAQPVDPATFRALLVLSEGEDADGGAVTSWDAMSADRRGTVTGEDGPVMAHESLDALIASLAQAGFKHVRIDLRGAPVGPAPTHGLPANFPV